MKLIQSKNTKIHQISLMALLLASLAGCGGGSDGSVDPPAPAITPKISLVAGVASGIGNQDGNKEIAHYGNQKGLGGFAVNRSGEIVFSDYENNTIRKISKDGVVSTLAGGGLPVHQGYSIRQDIKYADGGFGIARFNAPQKIVLDSAGNTYVNDSGNQVIRKIDVSGNVTTFAGEAGKCDYSFNIVSNQICKTSNMAIDSAGNIYTAEWHRNYAVGDGSEVISDAGNAIKKISPEGQVSIVSPKASIYSTKYLDMMVLYKYLPVHMAVDAEGTLYTADPNDRVVRKYINGEFKVFAGTLAKDNSGYVNGLAADAKFSSNITGMAFDKANNLYVLDDKRIRKVNANGDVSTVLDLSNACSVAPGHANQNNNCRFDNLAVDDRGNFLLQEVNSPSYSPQAYKDFWLLRQFSMDGKTRVVAGKLPEVPFADGDVKTARFSHLTALTVAPSGVVYAWDRGMRAIRSISDSGQVSSVDLKEYFGLNHLVADKNNNIYGALDSRIIKISPSGSVDVFVDFKKHFMPYYVKDELVSGMALAENGDIYVSYGFLNSVSMQISAVFKITPAGEISRLAGSLESMSGHRDGVGDDALFHSPQGLTLDAEGNLYMLDGIDIFYADLAGPAVRKITPTGEVTTLAGNINEKSGLLDGKANEAQFNFDYGNYKGEKSAYIAVDSNKNVYVTDPRNSVIRKITPAGDVSTLVGIAGVRGFAGEDLPGVINRPSGMAIHQDVLYFSMENSVAKIKLQ